MPQIVLTDIAKRYGKGEYAVEHLNLEIPEGSFTAILGPSGCGKTTTLRMLAGLEQPTHGSIVVGDRVFSSAKDGIFMRPNDRDLGFVFQNYALWPHLSVARNVDFGLSIQKMPRSSRQRRVEEILELLGIGHLANRLPAQLSGGEQQRVAVARALAPRPTLVLFDEPLSNLDAPLRLELSTELKRLHRELHMTALLVTHDQAEAMAVATMLVVMRAGTIEQIGSPTEVYRYPATTHVARFIGNPQMNIVAPAGALRDLADTLAVQYGVDQSAVRSIGIRPEHLAVGTTADGWRASARVNSVLATGPAVIVRLSLSDGIELTALCPSDTYLETGSETQLVLNPERVHCFGLDDRRLGQHTPSRELVGAGEVPGR